MVKHGAILCDPPWHFQTYSDKGQDRAAPYGTMSLDELKELPVAEMAADDCALFMWVIDPMLPEAMELLECWGFTFKTRVFEWVKTVGPGMHLHTGMGYWSRANPESCWLATRGKPKRLAKDVHRVIVSQIGQHSAKPDEQYERIERLVGGPYLEMFARYARPGWNQWGDQVGVRGGVPSLVDLPGFPAKAMEPITPALY